jgi:wobble nucleotide-excising tRNase
MLQRIVSIRNVGRFRRCAAVGDVTFRGFTFIFAENGRGKTTLCAILRSLGTNRPGFVIGRTTLSSTDRPEVQLLIGNATFAFRNGTWSAPFPEIAVFDGTYVSDNVFAGDVVDTNQRRNLYRVIIGAQGVTLAGRLNDLDNQIRRKNEDIRDNRARLQRHVPTGMTVETFIALLEDAGIDAKIVAREQDLQAA